MGNYLSANLLVHSLSIRKGRLRDQDFQIFLLLKNQSYPELDTGEPQKPLRIDDIATMLIGQQYKKINVREPQKPLPDYRYL